MVRVGEDQGILTLEPCDVRSRNATQRSRSNSRTMQHHYGAEPSFHRSASQCNAALVLVRACITPWTRPKPPINAFKWSTQGITPIYSRSAFYDYSCRSLLCSVPPVAEFYRNCAGVTVPSTHKTDGYWLFETINNERGFILILVYRYNESQHGDLILNLMSVAKPHNFRY